MIKIKKDAKLAGIRPEMIIALLVGERIYEEHGQPLVLTEGTGGLHNPGSEHFTGNAIDLRSYYWLWDIGTQRQVVAQIQEALGDDYQVILEKDHIHIEFDPRN